MYKYCLLLVLPLVVGGADYFDLPGKYCQGRPQGCCPGRQDDCAAPILGTLCYCDDFCNRTRSEDCCPDFWSYCKGMEPLTQRDAVVCQDYGITIHGGKEIKVNCNLCKCKEVNNNGQLICEQNDCMINPGVISTVNNDLYLGWTATNYSTFWGHKLSDGINLRLGTLQPEKAVMRMTAIKQVYDASRLPTTFDARSKWRGLIHGITDQGWCGASWAVSTASVASDRFAIMSNGSEAVTLAPNHLLSCNGRQRGCKGGHLDRAWMYMRKFGIVEESCYPYRIENGNPGACRLPKRGTLLTAHCPPSRHASSTRTDYYRMAPAYKIGSEEDIMYEIFHSGPVQATMKVYQDFFSYRGGIYKTTQSNTTPKTGYHSVRIVGWGGEGSSKYWLVANSWGPYWGENGFFRISRGTNECEIEQFVLASWAQESRAVPKGIYTKPYADKNKLRNDLG